VLSIQGELLADAQMGQWKGHMVDDHRRDRIAVETTRVKPDHRADRKPDGQLDGNAVAPIFALSGGQLTQAEVIRDQHCVGIDQAMPGREDEPAAWSVLPLSAASRQAKQRLIGHWATRIRQCRLRNPDCLRVRSDSECVAVQPPMVEGHRQLRKDSVQVVGSAFRIGARSCPLSEQRALYGTRVRMTGAVLGDHAGMQQQAVLG
jgi:hypothetical protein